jgi:cell division protein ZapE
MLEVHAGLRGLRHRQDPLVPIAAGIADRARVLCLDELFVADIGDAMVLAGLFRALIEHGVSLVMTSNTRPADLYRGGLQRDRFLPAIDLIEERTAVVHMDGPTDYRLRRLDRAPVFLVPDDTEAGRRLDSLFREMAGDGDGGDGEVLVHGRPIAVRRAAEGMLWFDFDELCRGHRSKLDYVEIARLCHTVFLSGIPVLTAVDDDAARRFIELVDVLYDRCVNVVASAAAEPEALYAGTRMARGFARATSRLHEFRSHAYLARPHRP